MDECLRYRRNKLYFHSVHLLLVFGLMLNSFVASQDFDVSQSKKKLESEDGSLNKDTIPVPNNKDEDIENLNGGVNDMPQDNYITNRRDAPTTLNKDINSERKLNHFPHISSKKTTADPSIPQQQNLRSDVNSKDETIQEEETETHDHKTPSSDQTKQEKLNDDTSALPLAPPPTELTAEEREALERKERSVNLYQEGMKLINSSVSRSSVTKGYELLREAADLGHADAEVELGFAHFMGVHLPQQITKTREIFDRHAASGNPRAQAGLGIMFATGIGANSSQAKALVYLTFSALGDDVMGRMILGYRYLSGIGVSKSCETSLNYYRTVADQVAAGVKLTGGSILMRVRLLDEVDRPGSNYGMVDEDLVQYYQFLADKGDTPAQVTLGQLNYQGSQGFELNHAKAFEYFSKAAEAGNGNALGYLGKIYAEGSESIKQNNATALKYFKLAAEKGNPIGHAGLGLMYLYGKGVDIDHEKAFKHFQTSADQGWPEGQLHLGNMYFNGLGVKRDFKQALRCFNLAAQNGHLLALYYLAKMHAAGSGVPRNCQTATEMLHDVYLCLVDSDKQQIKEARNGTGKLGKLSTPKRVCIRPMHSASVAFSGKEVKDETKSIQGCRLFKNVCERGRWSSMFELAYKQYKAGRVDSSIAIYMLLAELGYEVAQSNVAYILDQEQSRLFPNQTYTRALIHWDRAAEQGYATARLKLGDYHYYGKGTEVDYEVAASHYKIATEQSNNAQAMFNLGYMHEQGLGMKRDIHLAKRHYDMAAEASGDAAAPVALALIKIAFLFALDFLENQRWFHSTQWSTLSSYLSDDWDLYLMTLLALVLGFVVAYRRQRR